MLKKKTSHCYLLFVRRSIVAGFLPVNAVYGKIRIIYDVSLALVCFAHANCAMRNALRGRRIKRLLAWWSNLPIQSSRLVLLLQLQLSKPGGG